MTGASYAALATARHGAPDEQERLAEATAAAPASTWRGEILRSLYEGALARGDALLATRLESALQSGVVLEERLVHRAVDDPGGALADDGFAFLSVSGQRRVLAVCMRGLESGAGPAPSVLRESLEWVSPPSAFLQAMHLARAYAGLPQVAEEHLVALAGVATPSVLARADLLRAVAAALAARGSIETASRLAEEAAGLSRPGAVP